MKTLERFWQWFETEQPAVARAQELAPTVLSPMAWEQLNEAGGEILKRRGFSPTPHAHGSLLWETHWLAFRDLSLALLKARGEMRAAVPEEAISHKSTENRNLTLWWKHQTHDMPVDLCDMVDRTDRLIP